jgi:lipopolysaccharide biosynthesis glycosyltransferase
MKAKTLQVYLGWDSREPLAYNVARASILRRTKHPIQVVPLDLKHLDILTRPIEHRNGQMWCPISDAPMSTEFAISRFCVPFLQDHGWALFADCDIICWSDIQELFDLAEDKYAVMVVKHPTYAIPDSTLTAYGIKTRRESEKKAESIKMDGQIQTLYERKNWSSVVLWNCDHPSNIKLTRERLNNWPGRDLHAFKWLEDSEIGELPQHWNWLINVTKGEPERKGIWHFTEGGPWLEGWKEAKHDKDWIEAIST